MILALMLVAAGPQTAIDAERAFSADAHKIGQWTAFRKWAAPDAILFVPQPGSAHAFFKDKADPATAIYWWPGRSFVSCDGNTAVNTGPAVYGVGKAVGYFSTVWQRQPDGGGKWQLDHGDLLDTLRAEGGDIEARQADCATPPAPVPPKVGLARGGTSGQGKSKDGTLAWRWFANADNSHSFEALLWNGKDWEVVLNDIVKAR